MIIPIRCFSCGKVRDAARPASSAIYLSNKVTDIWHVGGG